MPRLILLLAVLLAPLSFAERPRLAVVIVVDQLSAQHFDYRLPQAKFGFVRMAKEGFRVREMEYLSAPTVTSPGHATLMTGTWPYRHGVVSNEWFDASLGKGIRSPEDAHYQVLGREPKVGDGTAPTALRSPTLGDTLKGQSSDSKVVAIAGKDRAAIFSAGYAADVVLWLDDVRPAFTSSTFYTKELPNWVLPVNARLQLAAGSFELPHSDLDSIPATAKTQKFVDAAQVDLALTAVKELHLGQDETPDLLIISFSGFDKIEHLFGPESDEVAQDFSNIDVEVGRLLNGLDKAVGKDRYVAVLTSDHGGAPNPDKLLVLHLRAGRVDARALTKTLEPIASEITKDLHPFEGYWTPGYYLTKSVQAKQSAVYESLREKAKSIDGVSDLLSSEILSQAGSYGPVGDYYRKGYFPGRSPNFILVTDPYFVHHGKDLGVHSSMYRYDRMVPLLWWGAGIGRGEKEHADATDVAVTLASLLGIAPPPSAEGKVISEVVNRSVHHLK